LDIVLNIVTPLFNDVKVLYENVSPKEIMLTNLKKETTNFIREIHPFTLDLYGPKLEGEFENIIETVPNIKYYEIIKNKVEPYTDNDFHFIYSFLKRSGLNILRPVD
jgi:hypothetical protein